MPKDPSEPSSESKKAEKATLKRNQACLRCRSRKLRCDAVRPTCGTCARSYNHAVQHLKPGQEPPPYPQCTFEDAATLPSASSASHGGGGAPTSQRAAKVGELESRISELEGMLKQAVGVEGLGMLAGGSASGSQSSGGGGGAAGAGGQQPTSRHQPQPQQRQQQQQPPSTVGVADWAGRQTGWMAPHLFQANQHPPQLTPLNQSRPGLPSFPSSFFNPSPSPMTFAPSSPALSLPQTSQYQQQTSYNNQSFAHPQQTTTFPTSSFASTPSSQPPIPPPSWPFLASLPTGGIKSNNPSTYDTFPPTQAQAQAQAAASSSSSSSLPPPQPRPSFFDSPTPILSPNDPTPSSSAPQKLFHVDTWPPRQQSGPTIEEVYTESVPSGGATRWGGPPDPPSMQYNPTGKPPMMTNIDTWPPQRQASGPTIEDLVEESVSSGGGRGGDAIVEEARQEEQAEGGMDVGGGFEGATGDEYLMQLLWPGWPSHLPSPGKLEHIVDTFFSVVPFATEVLNQARFLTRLALPPTHKQFPHPALLHSICAVTARYLGNVELVPTDTFFPLRFPARRNELDPLKMPTWDGFGNKPAITTPHLDEDFGEIHYRWSALYVDQSKENAGDWFSLVQALILLSQYCHQHAKWVQGWTHMSLMGRLVVPLGLNGRPFDPQVTPSPFRASLLEPPSDDIERIERANLAWLVFCQDTYSSTSSGWQGIIDDRDLYLGLPTSHSTFHAGSEPPYPTQFADDDELELFTHHPQAHCTAWSLNIKGTLLLRKISDFIRRADMRGDVNPRDTAEFKRLDKLITLFRSSFPPEFSNPLKCVTNNGKAIDRDLVMALTLPYTALITLHDRFTDPHDSSDPSNPRMMAAARGLLGQVYLVTSTNFDFSLLAPFMSYSWYLGAKTLIKALQVAMERKDKITERALHSEIQVFGHAIDMIAERLPIGARQKVMLNQILSDVLSDPTNRTVFPGNNCGLIINSLSSLPEATLTSQEGTPSSTSLKTPPAGPFSGSTPSSTTGFGALAGQPGFWLHSDKVMEEMDSLRAPWESRPSVSS